MLHRLQPQSEDHADLPGLQDKGRVIVEAKDTGLQSIKTYLESLVDRQ